MTGWRGVYAILEKVKELGLDKCDAGMSVGDVPAIVNIKTLKGRLITHKFNTGWAVGVVNKSAEKKKSVGQFQFAVRMASIGQKSIAGLKN